MSTDLSGQTWWIVGASSGLGAALAEALDKRGCRLILSARREEALAEIAGKCRDATVLPMDVSDPASIHAAVEKAGAPDALLYSVGLYDPMSAKDWDAEQAETMVDANFLGALRLIGRALPAMLARRSGRLVLVGSLSAFRGLPGAIGYSAPKAALLSLAESMRSDLRGTDLKVQIANPGFIRTRLTDKNDFSMPQIMEPEEAAAQVMRLIDSGRFRRDFPAPFAWLFRWSALIPYRLWDRLM
ncbi:SDR family NAD(P)-dependent oxidoreductase [Pseudoroseicyclus sp. CXY001]|uniref:SDR family NAD(P)-dependent oxidoreductase n=1 Tax=Pseudoroseicyclus sp. CXY001 TaxID=3242492 RepID=UPI00358DCDB6